MFFNKLKKSFSNLFNNKKCYLCNLKHQYTISVDPYHFFRIFLSKHSTCEDFVVTVIETEDNKSRTICDMHILNYNDALKEFFYECDRIKNKVEKLIGK